MCFCFSCSVLYLAILFVVMICFSGCHWRRAETVGRDLEAKFGQHIAVPRTVFRNWTTIDRGHFAESVVRKMREGHLERHPERRVSLAIAGLALMVFVQSVVWTQLSLIAVESKVSHKFQSSYQQRREHDWTRGFFFEWSAVMWFSSLRKTQRRLERMGSVFHWFWCPCQRDFADCVRMAPPADTCCRASLLERGGGVVHKGSMIVFLMLLGKLLTTFLRVRRA